MKKQKSFFILIAILIGIGLGFLIWNIFTPNSSKGIFYYQIENNKAKLIFITGKEKAKEVVSIPAREVNLGEYRPPRHSYISNNGKQMIYFKKTGEVPLEELSPDESIVVVRVIYEPILVNLKTNKERKIDQPIDSGSLVFSSNNKQIAWIKELKESTYEEIEESGKKRELWLSEVNGENAQLMASFDESVVLLKRWSGNYIYFQGLWAVNVRSLGRINTRTKEVDYLVPRHCDEFLQNCQNIELSPSGRKFIYEIYSKEEGREITELYLGDFDKKEFQAILTTDRISDRLWLNNEKGFFYTEQETDKKEGVKETIHLVNLKSQIDNSLYTGSYISQLTLSTNGRYLYFLEKEREGENFKLVKLDIRKRKTEIILTDDYNNLLLIQL